MKEHDCVICGNIVHGPGYVCRFCLDNEPKEYSREDEILEREEHNDYDEDREDFTPCTCSTFKCPKVIERFSKRQEAEKGRL